PRVVGGERLEPAKYLKSLDGLSLGQIGGAQEHAGIERLRLPRDEALQILHSRLNRTGLEVQLREQDYGIGEVGGNRGCLFQLGLGLLDVASQELGQRELLMRRGVARLELEHFLEILDRLVGFALGQMHAPLQELPLEV